MNVIVPAILPTSRKDLEEKLGRLVGLTNRVQIDIVDGYVASPATWPYASGIEAFQKNVAQGELLPHAGEFQFEVDMMVTDPEKTCGTWVTAGASSITLHASSTRYVDTAISKLRTVYGFDKGFSKDLLSVGIAIQIDTDSAILERYLDQIDYVQFMGIAHIGRQGEPFDSRVIRKIQAFRKKHPDMKVHVDGGVSLQSAPELLALGVSQSVVGSRLSHAIDLASELGKFTALQEQYGLYQ